MAVTTYSDIRDETVFGRIGRFFSAVFARMIKAREQEARRQVAFHLLALDDQQLDELGYSRAALQRDARFPTTL